MDRTERRVRLLTGLVLAGVFTAGAFTGAGVTRFLGRPPRGPGGALLGPPLPLRELDLTEAQRRQVDAVLERHRGDVEAVLKAAFPQVRAINKQVEDEVRGLLTEAQRQRLTDFRASHPPPPDDGLPPRDGPPGPGHRGPPPGPGGDFPPPGGPEDRPPPP
jgi:hypothetical protein